MKIPRDGSYSVPAAPAEDSKLVAPVTRRAAVGMEAKLRVLDSVYQESETGLHSIFYHGSGTDDAPQGYGYFAISDLPLDQITDMAERSILTRYTQEASRGTFALYQGNQSAELCIAPLGWNSLHFKRFYDPCGWHKAVMSAVMFERPQTSLARQLHCLHMNALSLDVQLKACCQSARPLRPTSVKP